MNEAEIKQQCTVGQRMAKAALREKEEVTGIRFAVNSFTHPQVPQECAT